LFDVPSKFIAYAQAIIWFVFGANKYKILLIAPSIIIKTNGIPMIKASKFSHKNLVPWFSLLFLLLSSSACQPASGKDVEVSTPTALPPHSIEIKTAMPTLMPVQTFTPEAIPTITATLQTTPTMQVHLMAVGDIMLGRTVGDLILTSGADQPFVHVADLLNSADVTIGNLESPISLRGEPEDKAYTFRAPPESATSLSLAGFDLVNLANNHALDYGKAAFIDTLQALSDQNIVYTGAGMDEKSAQTPVFIERNGLRIAFLGYLDIPVWKYDYTQWQATTDQPGVAWGFHYDIIGGVKKASAAADIVIVMMHFGNEYEAVVSQAQINTAHAAIDAGADLVIGSHPHVLQTIELYKDGLIAYSLGNFVFDQFYDAANKTAILSVHLSPNGIESYELIPVQIQTDGRPAITE